MCLIKFLCLPLSRFKVRTHTYIYIFSAAPMRRRCHCYYIHIIYIILVARGDFEADLFFAHRHPVNGDLLSTVDWLLVRFVQTFCPTPLSPTHLDKHFLSLYYYSNSTLTSRHAVRILRGGKKRIPFPLTCIKRRKKQ